VDTLDLTTILPNIAGGKDAGAADLRTYIAEFMGMDPPRSHNKTQLWEIICKGDVPEEILEAVKAKQIQTKQPFKPAEEPRPVAPSEDFDAKAALREFMLTEHNDQMKYLAGMPPEHRVAMLFTIPNDRMTLETVLPMRELYRRIQKEMMFLADEMFEVMTFEQRRESYTGPRSRTGQVAPIKVQVRLLPDPDDAQDPQLCSQGVNWQVMRDVVVDLPWRAFNALNDAHYPQDRATGDRDPQTQLPIYEQVEVYVYPFTLLGTIMPDGYGFADKSYKPAEEVLEPELEL
jgi:hypothetical protein|tara:strand:- start:4623 stop:5489 length:867 start_codon:yes stop_codon:yes gene_type:complete